MTADLSGVPSPARRSRSAREGSDAARVAPLPSRFYARDTAIVARALLGAVLECESADGVTSGRIVETEAYLGADDPACHAVAGITERTRHLHGAPGIAYVYRIYGMHWCFNAVTEAVGIGSAVLVRGIEPVDGLELMRARRPAAKRDRDLVNGPGKLCAALGITGALSGVELQHAPLVIRPGAPVPDERVLVTPRIGITRAVEEPLRWIVRDSEFVSATPRHFFQRPLRP